MLKAEEQMELAVLKKHGASIRGLSRSTGRSRNTVRRYLRGGDAVAKRKPAPKRAEKLDPFKAYIVGRMKAALPDRIPATVLFREIKERGYEGGETRVKLFVRGLTPLPAAAPAVRFETTPGRQMQADWATVGRGADKLSLFIATMARPALGGRTTCESCPSIDVREWQRKGLLRTGQEFSWSWRRGGEFGRDHHGARRSDASRRSPTAPP